MFFKETRTIEFSQSIQIIGDHWSLSLVDNTIEFTVFNCKHEIHFVSQVTMISDNHNRGSIGIRKFTFEPFFFFFFGTDKLEVTRH